MAPAAWRPVPGLPSTRYRAFLRRPDICCSNALLAAGPRAVLVVDPGADAAQAALLARFAGAALDAAPRPVVVVLTHCHLDHVLQAVTPSGRLSRIGAVLAAHDICATVLGDGDPVLSAAYLFGERLPRYPVPVRLFSGRSPEGPGEIRREPCCTAGLRGERLTVGGSPVAEVYPAPGHTPDSVVVRIGGLLLVGDLLFALDPGVTGLPGFDLGALTATAASVRRLVEEGGVVEVIPGHGRPLPAREAVAALERLERAARIGPRARPLTPERITATRILAQELLDEADRVFAQVGGRLLVVAHHLEALGEPEAATGVGEALPAGEFETCLASFNRFVREFEAGERVESQVLLKAVQATRRIESALCRGSAGDPAPLVRVRRLADDFMATITNGAPAVALVPVDLNEAVGTVVSAAQRSAVPDEAVLAAVDDERAFLDVLVRRLAAPPLFTGDGLRFAPSPVPVRVVTDPDRLGDGLR
ncbi:MAG TPA: MBL fold metallo-hydrolase, partial [Methanoregulaceae archaeon]|nr:MBL fold metallo-hydrolase [Methanoregulaceae archaeon]